MEMDDDLEESIEISVIRQIKGIHVALTIIGTVGPTAFLTSLNRPRDGVRPPPLARFEQSSSLSAPPCAALFDHVASWRGQNGQSEGGLLSEKHRRTRLPTRQNPRRPP